MSFPKGDASQQIEKINTVLSKYVLKKTFGRSVYGLV
jgi:hypothetical protein